MIAAPGIVAAAGTLAAGFVDARTGRIPNLVSRSTAIAALALAAAAGDAAASIWGAAALGGASFSLYAATRGNGIGLGDVKLAVAIGAGCGTAGGTLALAAAFILGGAYGAWLLATRRARRGDTIRFGPFLAAGTLLAVGASAVSP